MVHPDRDIAFDEIFRVAEMLDKHGNKIYKAQFKHDNTFSENSMSTNPYTVKRLSAKWIRKNRAKALDIIFEISVLGVADGSNSKETSASSKSS